MLLSMRMSKIAAIALRSVIATAAFANKPEGELLQRHRLFRAEGIRLLRSR